MKDSWEARFVDRQVARAWMAFRLRLAERFAAGIDEGMEPFDIETSTHKRMTLCLEGSSVVIDLRTYSYLIPNVDEAAFTVFRILHDNWQVVHPAFLVSDALVAPDVVEESTLMPAPAGYAESQEELLGWVVEAFQDDRDEKVQVTNMGTIEWATSRGEDVVVAVHNPARIEMWTVLARNVNPAKAHKEIASISAEYFPLKLYLRGNILVASSTVYARPFVAEHVTQNLGEFIALCDELKEVEAKIQGPVQETSSNTTTLPNTVVAIWVEHVKKVEVERDAALAELAKLKSSLKALKSPKYGAFPSEAKRGDAA